MSWIAQLMLSFNNWYYGVNSLKQALEKEENPLRIGILSAAAINYTAIFDPVTTHPGVIIAAIGARDKSKAQAQIDKFKVGPNCKAYGSYDEVVKDPSVDAIYIPLPNGLHAEWAIKAMQAGKHVLIEKAITSNADECRQIQRVSQETGKLALEAFHWRFHPSSHHLKDLLTSGKYGHVTDVFARLVVPTNAFDADDIRFQYSLGGGACLDLAYVFSACCFFGSDDISTAHFNVTSATARLHKTAKDIDECVESHFTVEEPGRPAVRCRVEGDLCLPPLWGFVPRLVPQMPFVKIETEKASISFNNFVIPTFGHTITITDKATGEKTVEKVYTGGPKWGSRGEVWWTTYRYQLEAFVEAVKKKEAGGGEEFEGPLVGLKESEKVMECIDLVYDRMGLPRRGVQCNGQ